MGDADDQVDDLLGADSADLATLESEPMEEAESAPPKAEPESKPELVAKKVKKVNRSDERSEGAGPSKRVPIPVPPPSVTGSAQKAALKSKGTSVVRSSSKKGSRYFIMKSVSGPNLEYSMAHGVWATQKHNEDKLQEAFSAGGPVYLIFSLVSSGHFQGFARMVSGFQKSNHQWPGSVPVGDVCKIKWERRSDLGFRELEHLRNPLNDDKPLKVCRDGQELPADIGDMLVKMFHERPEQPMIRNGHAGMGPPPGMGGHGGRHPFRNGLQRPPMMGMRPMMPMGQNMMGRHMGPVPPPPMGMLGDPFMGGAAPADIMGMLGGGGGAFPGGRGLPGGLGGRGMMNNLLGGLALAAGRPSSLGMSNGVGFGRGMGIPGRGAGPRPPPRPPAAPELPLDRSGMFGGAGMGVGGMNGGLTGRLGPTRGGGLGGLAPHTMDLGRNYMDVDEDAYGSYRESRSRRDDRSRRERSASGSPRRSRRRRSRSRSRSRERKNITEMSYDEYLEVFNKVQENARNSSGAGQMTAQGMMGMNPMMGQSMMANPMMGQGMGMMGGGGGMGMGGMGSGMAMGNGMGMGNGGDAMGMGAMGMAMGGQGGGGGVGRTGGGMAADMNPANLTEENYVQIWQDYSRQNNQPFNAELVRSWYRTYKAST